MCIDKIHIQETWITTLILEVFSQLMMRPGISSEKVVASQSLRDGVVNLSHQSVRFRIVVLVDWMY